jgi:multidrug efflux pump
MAVFIPMAFFPGSSGAIYRQFAVTLVLTMMFSALMALTLTPALCATLLKHTPGKDDLLPSRGPLGWFNRFFARSTTNYTGSVGKIVKKTSRYLLVYAVIFIAMGWLFSKLPGSFLPAEDQGYFINVIQLPPGATQERTLEVLSQVEKYYLGQKEVDHVIGVAGFSFVGRGQNVGIAFVTLKNWDERSAEGSSSVALVRKANMALFMIKQAMIFAVNPPPIPELAALGGFDFRLEDRGGVGRDKLLEARNMALGMAARRGRGPAQGGQPADVTLPAGQRTLPFQPRRGGSAVPHLT